MAPKEFLPFSKVEETTNVERRGEVNILRDKLRFYELVMERYKQTIERNESKTIADLKALIQPKDEAIQHKKEEIIANMRPYIFEQHFNVAAELAHKTVREMRTLKAPVDFWLTPKEMLNLRGGDPMDKAIFLCSLLVALENTDTYVIVGVNSGIRVAVGYNFKDEWRLIDPTGTATIKGEKDSIIHEWFGNEHQIYEFNHTYYNQLKGEE